MDYNSNRKKLPLPEYGRNIQNMVEYLLTIEDRDKRTREAHTVIDVMGNLYTYLRDVEVFKHKFWDHLSIMADFKLDIDYPYEPPTPDILTEKPNRVPYNQHSIKYRHYGLIMENMIKEVSEYEDEEKEALIEMLANHMKKTYLVWNKDAVEDEKIFLDLEELSDGKIKIEDEMQLSDIKSLIGKKKKKTQNKSQSQNKSYKRHNQ